MKNRYNLAVLATLIMLASSCTNRKVSMQTIIDEDGTCLRIFNVSLDRNENEEEGTLRSGDFDFDFFVDTTNMAFDDSWTKTWSPKQDVQTNAFPISESTLKQLGKEMKKNGQKGTALDTIRVDIQQKFASVDEMCAKCPLKYNGKNIESKGELTKSFKWFYTDYTYTETYATVADNFAVPPTQYMTEEEAAYWFAGESDITKGMKGNEVKIMLDNVEGKVNKWFFHNYIYDISEIIVNNYDSVDNAPLSKEEFVEQRDSLIKYSLDKIYDMWGKEDFVQVILNDYFHSEAYSDMLNKETINKQVENLLSQKYIYASMMEIDYALALPGEMTNVYNGTLTDGMAHYNLSIEHMIMHDYVIKATSRTKNLWAYGVTILILCIAIGSYIYRRKK